LVKYINLLTGVIACYLSISFILQTKDDFRFVIPYVEFSKQTKGARPILLDTSVLIDGRITDVVSTGIIESDTWGNLPGGETFIAPVEGTATGEYLLNGSFTGHVLRDDQPLVLRFDAGRLAGVDGTGIGREASRTPTASEPGPRLITARTRRPRSCRTRRAAPARWDDPRESAGSPTWCSCSA